MAEHWIQGMHMKRGGLHKALGVPQGEEIPHDKMVEAAHSTKPHVRRMANLAKTLKKLGR